MKYMGSKNRHSKALLDIILKNRGKNQPFVEPFVGGANILDKVGGLRIGSDIDPDLIALWQAVSDGWMPPKNFTEAQYAGIKKESPSALKGYAAFALSYGGKKFGGWCRDSAGKRNYVDEAYRNAETQFPKLRGVDFRLCHYTDLIIPDGCILYCDPPYEGTTKYKSDFNHELFWEWCRQMAERHTVFVSEYSAPKDFECLWEKEVTSSLTADTGSKRNTERLFILRGAE